MCTFAHQVFFGGCGHWGLWERTGISLPWEEQRGMTRRPGIVFSDLWICGEEGTRELSRSKRWRLPGVIHLSPVQFDTPSSGWLGAFRPRSTYSWGSNLCLTCWHSKRLIFQTPDPCVIFNSPKFPPSHLGLSDGI